RRGREQDLTAAAARAETCRADDVEADVAGVAHRRLSRVQSDPDADDGALGPFVLRVCKLGLNRSGDGVRGAGEHEKERVSLRVDLGAAVRGERLAHEAAMV